MKILREKDFAQFWYEQNQVKQKVENSGKREKRISEVSLTISNKIFLSVGIDPVSESGSKLSQLY